MDAERRDGLGRETVCGTCHFWVPPTDPGGGTCRRFPPVPTNLHDRWPRTHDDQWCGEHVFDAVAAKARGASIAPSSPKGGEDGR